MVNELIIKVDRLSKSYPNKNGDFMALRDVSFDLKKREKLGVIGGNGAGKSTLLKLISGVSKPDFGKIQIFGSSLSILGLGVGFHPDLSALDNIIVKCRIFGIPISDINKISDKVIEFSELFEFRNEPVKNFSDGMYVRLAVSLYLELNSDLLIFDEILSAGDAGFQKKVIDRLNNFSNNSIIMVSHDLDLIKKNCDKILYLENGSIVKIGPINDVLPEYKMRTIENFNQTKINIFERKFIVSEAYSDDFVRLSDLMVVPDSKTFLISSKIDIVINVRILNAQKIFGLIFFVKDFNGNHFHLDSLITRNQIEKKDKFITFPGAKIEVSYPSYFFDKGIYSLGVILTNEFNERYKRIDDIAFLKVEVDDFEKNKTWVEFDCMSRLRLNWNITHFK